MSTEDKYSSLRELASEGYLLYKGDEADGYKVLDVMSCGHRRWSEGKIVVIQTPDDELVGFEYDEGLTEYQDSEYPWDYDRTDWEVFEVEPYEVTQVRYRKKTK